MTKVNHYRVKRFDILLFTATYFLVSIGAVLSTGMNGLASYPKELLSLPLHYHFGTIFLSAFILGLTSWWLENDPAILFSQVVLWTLVPLSVLIFGNLTYDGIRYLSAAALSKSEKDVDPKLLKIQADLMIRFSFDDGLKDTFIRDPRLSLSANNLHFVKQGRFGGAGRFSGQSTIKLPSILMTNAGTWALWFKMPRWWQKKSRMRLIDANGYHIALENGRLIAVFKGQQFVRLSSGPIRQAGKWYHVAMTWGNGAVNLYLNGSLVETNGCFDGRPALKKRNLLVGARWTGIERGFNGDMDEITIFRKALNAEEIKSLMTFGLSEKHSEE